MKSSRIAIVLAAGLVVICAISGCNRGPNLRDQIIGTWVDRRPAPAPIVDKQMDLTLRLSVDGTFQFTTIVIDAPQKVDVEGDWSLDDQVLLLTFRKINAGDKSAGGRMVRFGLITHVDAETLTIDDHGERTFRRR